MYNPFYWNEKTGLRGKVYNTHITGFSPEFAQRDKDLAQIIVQKLDERLKDVQRYPLKIVVVEKKSVSQLIIDKTSGKRTEYTNLDAELTHILVERVRTGKNSSILVKH